MKKIFLAVVIIGLFSTCKKTPEPFKPTCTHFTLEKVDSNVWKYCRVHNNSAPVKCNDKNDTLTLKILKHFDNIKATVRRDGTNNTSEHCLLMDLGYEGVKDNGTKVVFSLLYPLNLPECFKKDKLKVLISGDLRPYPGLSELNCGELFELTKIEEIP
ncbi:MAG: hypothetical protein RIS64_3969 [Bacteroidota bacterium]|jgi:hypothetical protein